MKTFDEEKNEYIQSAEKKEMEIFISEMKKKYSRFMKLIEFLDNTEFWLAPASSKHHLNRFGGLAQHSRHVFNYLEKTHNLGRTEQNLMIAFCHDICKLNIYQGKISKSFEYYTPTQMEDRKELEQFYNKKIKTNSHISHLFKIYNLDDHMSLKKFLFGKGRNLRSTFDLYKPVFSVDDSYPIGHGEKSIILSLQNDIELTNEEIVAIRWHMGFDDKNWTMYRKNVHKKYYSLVKALQRADQDATHQEDEEE